MLCENPVSVAGGLFGCGKCPPCLHKKRREWSHRIELEMSQHEHNTFLTLTYSDEMLPPGGSLEPHHLRDFLKRLRRSHEPERLRYFSVGEYGSRTWRPHYHAALFNYAGCERQQSTYGKDGLTCCQRCKDVQRIWGYGNVYLGRMETASARYVCGYVLKKMTRRDDPRLNGRYPEFARMSLRPWEKGNPGGIGATASMDVAQAILQNGLQHDVSSIEYGKSSRPLGTYLTRSIRKLVHGDPKAPQSVMDAISKEMLPVRLAAKASQDDPSVKSQYLKKSKGKLASFKAKAKIFGVKNETW